MHNDGDVAGRIQAVFSYTQIIFSAFWGFMFFGQLPDLWSWIGYVIIIGMAILMMIYNRHLEMSRGMG